MTEQVKNKDFSMLKAAGWLFANLASALLVWCVFSFIAITLLCSINGSSGLRSFKDVIFVMLLYASLGMPIGVFLLNAFFYKVTRRQLILLVVTVVLSIAAFASLIIAPMIVLLLLKPLSTIGLLLVFFSPAVVSILGTCLLIANGYFEKRELRFKNFKDFWRSIFWKNERCLPEIKDKNEIKNKVEP